MNKDDEVIPTKRILERLRMYRKMQIPGDMMVYLDFDVDFNNWRLSFEKDLLADRVAEDSYTKTVAFIRPKTTWQMFKHTHAGSWWLAWLVSRRPVEYEQTSVDVTVEVKRYLTYPDMAIEEYGRHFIYEQPDIYKKVRE